MNYSNDLSRLLKTLKRNPQTQAKASTTNKEKEAKKEEKELLSQEEKNFTTGKFDKTDDYGGMFVSSKNNSAKEREIVNKQETSAQNEVKKEVAQKQQAVAANSNQGQMAQLNKLLKTLKKTTTNTAVQNNAQTVENKSVQQQTNQAESVKSIDTTYLMQAKLAESVVSNNDTPVNAAESQDEQKPVEDNKPAESVSVEVNTKDEVKAEKMSETKENTQTFLKEDIAKSSSVSSESLEPSETQSKEIVSPKICNSAPRFDEDITSVTPREPEKGSFEHLGTLLSEISDNIEDYQVQTDDQGRIKQLIKREKLENGFNAETRYHINYENGRTTIEIGGITLLSNGKIGPKTPHGYVYDEQNRLIREDKATNYEKTESGFARTISYNKDGGSKERVIYENPELNNGIKTEEKVTNADGSYTITKYDAQGNEIVEKPVIPAGEVGSVEYAAKLLGMDVSEIASPEYDEKGMLISFTDNKMYIGGEGPHYTVKYENIENKIVTIEMKQGGVETPYAESQITYKADKMWYSWETEYDYSGQVVSRKYVMYNDNGNRQLETIETPQAADGVVKTVTRFSEDGETVISVEKYDKDGNLIPDTPVIPAGEKGSIEWVAKLGIIPNIKFYRPEYDSKGRVTQLVWTGEYHGLAINTIQPNYYIGYADNGSFKISALRFMDEESTKYFDEKGVLTETFTTTYQNDGNLRDVAVNYDKNGNKISEFVEIRNQQTRELVSKKETIYNDDGSMLTKTFDKENRLMEEIFTSIEKTTIRRYDAEGRLTYVSEKTPDGRKETIYDPDGSYTITTYDANGNVISQEVVKPDQPIIITEPQFSAKDIFTILGGKDGDAKDLLYNADWGSGQAGGATGKDNLFLISQNDLEEAFNSYSPESNEGKLVRMFYDENGTTALFRSLAKVGAAWGGASNDFIDFGEIVDGLGLDRANIQNATISMDVLQQKLADAIKLEQPVIKPDEVGSMEWLKNILGEEFANNEFNTVSCDLQGRIVELIPYDVSSPKFKGDGKTYRISYADDGQFKIATQLDGVEEIKYFDAEGNLISQEIFGPKQPVKPVISAGERGSVEYAKELILQNGFPDMSLNDFAAAYDEQGRVVELNFKPVLPEPKIEYDEYGNEIKIAICVQAPPITKFEIAYAENGTTTVKSINNVSGQELVRTFDKNGVEIVGRVYDDAILAQVADLSKLNPDWNMDAQKFDIKVDNLGRIINMRAENLEQISYDEMGNQRMAISVGGKKSYSISYNDEASETTILPYEERMCGGAVHSYTYNKEGKLIRENISTPSLGPSGWKTIIEYKNDGSKTETKTWYDASYNNGIKTEITVYNPDGSVKEVTKIREYEPIEPSLGPVISDEKVTFPNGVEISVKEGEKAFVNQDGAVEVVSANGKTSTTYDVKGNKTADIHRYDDGTIYYQNLYTYDENNKMTSHTREVIKGGGTPNYTEYFNENGQITKIDYFRIGSGEFIESQTNSYDENGNLIKEIYIDKNDKLTRTSEYAQDGSKIDTFFDEQGNKSAVTKYDKDGKMVSEEILTGDFRQITYYNANGQVIAKREESSEGVVETNYKEDGSYTVTKYDVQGNIVSQETINPEQPVIPDDPQNTTTRETFYVDGVEHLEEKTYSPSGQILIWSDTKLDDNSKSVNSYNYDENDKLLSHKNFVYDKDGQIVQRIVYEYDETGSVISETEYDVNGNIIKKED